MTPTEKAGGDAESKGIEGYEQDSGRADEATTADESNTTSDERAGGDAESKGVS